MAKKVLIISTSIRPNSNSEIFAKAFADGARTSGNDVEIVFCIGFKMEQPVTALPCRFNKVSVGAKEFDYLVC